VNVPANYDPDHDRLIVHPTVKDAAPLNEEGIYLPYVSHLRLIEIDASGSLLQESILKTPSSEFDKYGCEDARATIVGDTIEVTYNGIGRYGSTGMVISLDSHTLEVRQKDIVILGPDQKHQCIFGKTSARNYFLLCRPLVRTTINAAGAWLLTSSDLRSWRVLGPLLLPRSGAWDSDRVGPGTPPRETSQGWLMFYYGVDREKSYHIGAALLDGSDPSRVIARSAVPIFSPTEDWELHGRRADIVFPTGLDILGDDVTLFYGAADMYIAIAKMSLGDVLAHLSQSS
jgi:predicted GH43/DUF377 family glycosyl hydrolase